MCYKYYMNKFLNFFKNKKEYFITGIFVSVVFLIFLSIAGAWPFGSNTFAKYDGYYQTVQFFGNMFDVLDGNATITYSNLIGGGANTVAVLLYFFLNPFSFIALIFGRNNIYFAINIIYLLYFILISISFLYFLRKKYPEIKKSSQILLSCCYAFCGYALCNQTIIVWLNFLIILPLLWIAFENLIHNGKICSFSILTAFIIYSSYAVGSSMQIILMLVYFLFVHIVLPKENRKSAFLNLLVGLFCGLLLSLIVLVPSFLGLQTSCRLSGENGSLFNYVNLLHFYDYSASTGILFNLLNSSLLFVSLWHLIKTFKTDALNKFLLFALILCNLPILFDDISHFISGGSYLHFSTRFFSVNSFLMFLSAARAFSHHGSQKTTAPSIPIKNNISVYFLIAVFSIIFALTTSINFMSIGNSLAIGEIDIHELPVFICAPLTIIAFVFILFVFNKTKMASHRLLSTLILIIIGVESFLSGMVVLGTGAYPTTQINAYNELTSSLSPNTRVKDGNEYIGSNGNLVSGVSSFSIFSSAAENNTYLLSQYLGYGPSTPDISNRNGSLFSDLLLGYEYIVTERNLSDRSYLTLQKEINGVRLYKYNFSFPHAFVLDDIITPSYDKNIEDRQNELARMLGASHDIIVSQNIDEFSQTPEDSKMLGEKFTDYQITFTAQKSGVAYFCNHTISSEIRVYDSSNEYCGKNCYDLLDVCEVQAGQTYTFTATTSKANDLKRENFSLKILSVETLEAIVAKTNQNKVDITYTKSGFSLDAKTLQNKNILVVHSNPKGMNYQSDSKNSQIAVSTKIYDLTYIQNVTNETITAEFVYPHTTAVFVLGIGGIVLAILIIIIFSKKRHAFKVLETPALVIYLIIASVLAIYFYLVPSTISIFKYIGLLTM